MAPHQERVVTEKRELDDKIAKLRAFTTMQNVTFAGLPYAEQERLIRQRGIMEQYSTVLAERITAFSLLQPSTSRAELFENVYLSDRPVNEGGPVVPPQETRSDADAIVDVLASELPSSI